MPPKAKFTKEEIIQTALDIVEKEGADALTARLLGERLGSSARPIFTVFNGMEEVQAGVIAAANALYGEFVEVGLKEDIAFKGVGKAYIRFAAEHPKLFQLLFMKEHGQDNEKDTVLQGIEEHYEQIIQSVESTYALDRNVSLNVYMHMWIYTHGIAVLIATKVCNFTPAQISVMLTEVFSAILRKIKTEGKL